MNGEALINSLRDRFDVVVVLSQSDWYNEMRGNRYHYTIRFSNLLPVYFVQSYNPKQKSFIQGVEGNITIVNPIHDHTEESIELLLEYLRKKSLNRVLFWVYAPYYAKILERVNIEKSIIYHATEAYLGSDMLIAEENHALKDYIQDVRKIINQSSLVITVSEGVREGIVSDADIITPVNTVTNGCDFKFWNGFSIPKSERKNAVIYQGGIHRKLDFSLINYLVDHHPNIEFWFCGSVYFSDNQDQILWKALIKKQNVKYFGVISPDAVRDLCHQAKVGIIPFKVNDWLSKRAFPLKAFEYLSAGLEVVSTKIDDLSKFSEHFTFTNDYEQFSQSLSNQIFSSQDYDLHERVKICEFHDYDTKFLEVLQLIHKYVKPERKKTLVYAKKKILFLYDLNSCHVGTIREHLNSYGLFSRHTITFYNATSGNRINEIFLNTFDAVAIHYSVRVSVNGHLSNDIHNKLSSYKGLKILFIQDEYDNLKSTYLHIKNLGIDIVFTCVPPFYHNYVYPRQLFPSLKLVNNLTGYVSYSIENMKVLPIKERPIDVFYRGRALPLFYGTLGKEKYEIGKKFGQYAKQIDPSLVLDLESEDSKRIYGDAWYARIGQSKVMLGTESGSNVFDFEGNLKDLIAEDLNQGRSEEYIFEKYIHNREKEIVMNQISPKIFEAISLKTVLILYEGSYSGIVIPYRHYIPLKKDFSNIEEVCRLIKDDNYLQSIADIAYDEVILKENYSYEHYVQNVFDKTIDQFTPIVKSVKVHYKGTFKPLEKLYYFIYRKDINIALKYGISLPHVISEEYEYELNRLKETKSIKDSFLQFVKYQGGKSLRLFNDSYASKTLIIFSLFKGKLGQLKNRLKKFIK